MANKKGQIIVIKKKKGGGHAAHHGGAWKVAYADFVTAMMAFFLVMWLMGADEETKAQISDYFNQARTPWKADRDDHTKEIIPVGERTGQGESILTGMGAGYPEDLIARPNRPPQQAIEANRNLAEEAKEVLDGQAYGVDVSVEFMKFSVPSSLIFMAGTKDFAPGGEKYLDKLGQMFKSFSGYVTIAGHSPDGAARMPANADPYEFSLSRSVTVMRYLTDKNWVTEDRMTPLGNGNRHKFSGDDSPDAQKKNDRIEFTLGNKRP